MKRGVLFDPASATLAEVNEMWSVVERRREELLKERQHKHMFVKTAAQEYINYKSHPAYYEKKEYTSKEALTMALWDAFYSKTMNMWTEMDISQLAFGDDMPCTVDDCYYSGNSDRLGGVTFYINLFNNAVIVCDLCITNCKFDFEKVFTPEMIKSTRRDVRKAANSNKKSKTK
jgi:hypothetical protein